MESNDNNHPLKNTVHRVLAHSYYVFFLLFLIGVCLDLVFKVRIFSTSFILPFGFLFLTFGTILIFWAQHTSRTINKENITKDTFLRGPYRYTRSPTHWGLFLLMLGFGMVANAFFIFLSSILSFIITKYTFLNKQEKILEERYGAPYFEYKKSVKL
jgi:protein-S-isoprenylcysteine O-methyltransferase Ste14